jgi:hypothetical protein
MIQIPLLGRVFNPSWLLLAIIDTWYKSLISTGVL